MTPKLILISGPPGVGKSTLAQEIAKKTQALLLDKDCVDEPFSPNDRGEIYSQNIEPKVLQALLNLSRLNLALGKAVILDLPWSHIMLNTPHWVQAVKDLAYETQAKLKVVELHLEENTLFSRIRARGLKRDECKLTPEGQKIFKKTDRLGERIPMEHFLVDASQPLSAYYKNVLEYLDFK